MTREAAAPLGLRDGARHGVLVPPLTPFTDDQAVDFTALESMVDYCVEQCGAGMIVAAGVEAQEYQYLDLAQRRDLVAATVEGVDGRVPVAAGISHPSFKRAIELAHFAEANGAQALQLLAPLRPFGGVPTVGELVSYYEAVARETSLPIILYLNAGPGSDVSVAGTVELTKLDCIHYVKESSRDLARVSRLVVEIEQAGHARYFTTMQMLLATLQLGGSGAAVPPPAAALATSVVRAFDAGDPAEATRLQAQFALFPARWMHHGLMPTMKAALNLLGVPAGDPYPPFPPISGDDLDSLRNQLDRTDLPS